MRGNLPRYRLASYIVETTPGLDVEALTDTALKGTNVRAGISVLERQFGTLQFHSGSTAKVHAAATPSLTFSVWIRRQQLRLKSWRQN